MQKRSNHFWNCFCIKNWRREGLGTRLLKCTDAWKLMKLLLWRKEWLRVEASVPESVCLREQNTLLASLYTSTIPRETDSAYKAGRQAVTSIYTCNIVISLHCIGTTWNCNAMIENKLSEILPLRCSITTLQLVICYSLIPKPPSRIEGGSGYETMLYHADGIG